MKRACFHLASLFLLFLGASLATAAAPTWPHEQCDLPPDPAVTWGNLPNGLRYAIVKHDDPAEAGRASRRVSLRFYVRAGSLMERDDQQGLAHFLEHMAFRGTKHFPAGEMVKYFQRLGMGFVSDTNAETGQDRTVYKLELPENSDAYLDDALVLFRDFADGMLLQDKQIDQERGVILNEKLAHDSVDMRGLIARLKFSMPDALVPRRLPIGMEQVIRTAGHEQLAAFYREWYVPERMTVVVAGPVDPARVASMIEAKFGSLPRSKQPAADPDLGKVLAGGGLKTQLHFEPAADCATIVLENWRPAEFPAENRAARRDELRQLLAMAMLNRRLKKLAGGKSPAFLDAAAAREVDARAFAGHRLAIVCKPEAWQTALSAAEQELRRAAQFGFNETEFREVKAIFAQIMENRARQAGTRLSPDMADGIVSALVAGEVFSDPATDLAIFNQMLETITLEDCAAALKKGWCSDDVFVFVHGNLPIKDGDRQIREVYLKSRKTAVEPSEADRQLTWAYANFGPSGHVARREDVKDLGLSLVTFDNNVHLNLKPTKFEKDAVYVSVSFGGGLLTAPRDKPGLVQFANRRFIGGGLEKFNYEELNRVLAGKTASADFTVGDEFFKLTGNTNRKDLGFQLQLLCAYLNAAGFRRDREAIQAQNVDAFYIAAQHDVSTAIACEVPGFFFRGDARLAFPRREEYKARTMAELKNWLADARASSWLEIGIIGDFDPQAAIDGVARTFGALPRRAAARPEYARERQVAIVHPPCVQRIEVDSRIPKATALVFWPTTDARRDMVLVRQCSVLAAILGERLREKVREQLGKTYTPMAMSDMSDTFNDDGELVCQLTCEADQAQQVGQIVAELAAKLAAEGATPDELERAKRPILSGVEKDRRDNDWWMEQLVSRAQSAPQRLDWIRARQADYEAVNLQAINRLAKTYLPKERAIIVLAGPRATEKTAADKTAAVRAAEVSKEAK